MAGIVYPRLCGGKRVYWRDLHAVTGIWLSVMALFVISSGLPWAKGWGSYLKTVRTMTGAVDGPVDWTIGGKSDARAAMLGDHAEHQGMDMTQMGPMPGELNRAVATATALNFAGPVLVAPPAMGAVGWAITSDTAHRPLRSQAVVDGASGRVLARKDFDQRHWIDRAVGYGIAIHEGQFFGILNQVLITLTAAMLVTMSVSGTVLWWRRRPEGRLGAPVALSRPRFGAGLIGAIIAMGVLLPLFGASLVAVLVAERLVLRRSGAASRWLGLKVARA